MQGKIFIQGTVKLVLLLMFFFVSTSVYATTTETIVIQPGPTEGKDTYYGSSYKTSGQPDSDKLEIAGWGDWYYSYLQMDLSSLPTTTSNILSADLYLYNYQVSGTSNNAKLERITQSWTESGVTLASNPTATTTGMSWQSIPFNNWWVVDITDLTKDWLDGTYTNYGVKLLGQYNSGCCYPQKAFYSSDETTNATLRPKLVVEMINHVPSATDLLTNSQINPDDLYTSTPLFSAIYQDNDQNDKATSYRIQVDNDSDFSSPIWDSGKTAMATTTEGNLSPSVTYAGSSLSFDAEYFWRIKFWDDGGAEGTYSTTTATFELTIATTTETIVIQPGPSTGKDTYFGTGEKTTGAPDFYRLEVGGWGDWYYSYLQMDLSSLPTTTSNILDAELQLFSYQLSATANNGKIERITEPWTESAVTLSSNPAATTTGMSWQNIPLNDWWVVDITDLTKDWLDGTYTNYGVKLLGQYNSGCCYPQKAFYSSDETTNATLRPKMVVTVLNSVPFVPSNLLTNSQTNPTNLSVIPTFSAIFNDNDSEESLGHYRIQVDDSSDFSSPIWDSGQVSMEDVGEGDRSEEITYDGSSLDDSVMYYWRIKFWDDGGAEGTYSTETATFSIQ